MKAQELQTIAKDSITARRVFAEPYEKDGVTVIAAATISGGAGGGSGTANPGGEGSQEGEGGGFGLSARPTGAYVITDGKVHWRPAIDVTRLATIASAVAVVFMITRARTVKVRARAARHS